MIHGRQLIRSVDVPETYPLTIEMEMVRVGPTVSIFSRDESALDISDQGHE